MQKMYVCDDQICKLAGFQSGTETHFFVHINGLKIRPPRTIELFKILSSTLSMAEYFAMIMRTHFYAKKSHQRSV